MRKEKPLSKRQENILKYILDYMEEHSRPPTIREIGTAVKISSTSVVNYNLTRLTERGLLEREPEVSRGLRLTKQALELLGVKVTETVRKAANTIERMVQIPMVGTIAAGKPIDLPNTDYTLFDEDEAIDISVNMLHGKTDGLFALTVQGNSMIDAMVNDGDIVVMREQKTANNGDMVAVWLKDDDSTTLKRFYNEGSRVRLQPANPTMGPIYVEATDVEVQGKVLMVVRQVAS